MTQPVKILLVDDLDANLVALEALLAREGVALYRARSGREALELLLVHEFALSIIDVHMPGMDGFELAELMRGTERARHVPIIFTTAAPQEQQRVFKGYDAGAVDFLFKPIDSRILRHKTNVFLELYVQRQQLAAQVSEREVLLDEMRKTLRLNEMFTAVLGHDLRSPLAAILAGAKVLEGLGGSETKVVARRIRSSAERMARMIDQLLDLARARLAGGILVTRARMHLGTCARRIVAEASESHAGRPITLDCTGDLIGAWDEERLCQVLSNLLANALQHGQDSSPVLVRIDGCRMSSLHLSVHNAGYIEPEIVPRLFDPFRAGDAHPHRGDGLGLGLYIVDQIVRAHGGSVKVFSAEGVGTTFDVELPRWDAEAVGLAPLANSS